MTVEQRFRIQNIGYRLNVSPDVIEQAIQEAISVGGEPPHVNDALAAAELFIAEYEHKISPPKIWAWFLAPIPALEGKSLLQAALNDGVDSAQDYIERIRYGDYS